MHRVILVDVERKPAVLVTTDINGMPLNHQTFETLVNKISIYLMDLIDLNQTVELPIAYSNLIKLIYNLLDQIRPPKTQEQILILKDLCNSEVKVLDSISLSELYEKWKQFASYPEVLFDDDDGFGDLDEEGIVK